MLIQLMKCPACGEMAVIATGCSECGWKNPEVIMMKAKFEYEIYQPATWRKLRSLWKKHHDG